jgi:hypothetical protein
MKRRMRRILTAGLVVGLVLGAVIPTQAARKELVVGRFETFLSGSSLFFGVSISGTGNIFPGGGPVEVTNTVLGAEGGDDEAAALAFTNLAQSQGCVAGDLAPIGGPSGGFSVSFLCEGSRGELLTVIGELLKFPLTFQLSP